MIMVSLGSQKFQFDRLLVEIDELVRTGVIKENVFAQIGRSDYKPKYYEYVNFLQKEDFINYINKSNLVITHAGTATIITALKSDKKVIAVARLKKYKEHVSDHQLDIIRQFTEMNLIIGLVDVSQLKNVIENINNYQLDKYVSNTNNIIGLIENFISENV